MALRFQSGLVLALLVGSVTVGLAQDAKPSPKPKATSKAKAKAAPAPSDKPMTEEQKLHYMVGRNLGQKLRADFPDLDEAIFSKGVHDSLVQNPSPVSDDEAKALFTAFQKRKQEEGAKRGETNLKAGQDFLAANKTKEGVTTLPSGVQYRILKAAEGEKPTPEDKVVAHYRGTLLNGKEFDSSYKRNEPTTFPVKGVIPGWQQILPLMTVGSKWQIFVPADQAYGPRGAGGDIGPNETLIFEIELIKVIKDVKEVKEVKETKEVKDTKEVKETKTK
jgi:FKBP-type peptidyl-prolyl cis-trans isomerase FklB